MEIPPATPLESLDPSYVTGFVEGAGHFTYSRSGRSVSLYFAIKLAARDGDLLKRIRSFFRGIGSIFVVSTPRGSTRHETRYFRVTRLDHLATIVQHFDRYPLKGTKAQAYAVWREMFQLKLAVRRRPASSSLRTLASRLSQCSSRITSDSR